MTLYVLAYLAVGLVVGCRTSSIVAWKHARKSSKGMDWWYTPAPLGALLGCLAAWPLAFLVMLGAWRPVHGFLFPTPKPVKRERVERTIKRLERELG